MYYSSVVYGKLGYVKNLHLEFRKLKPFSVVLLVSCHFLFKLTFRFYLIKKSSSC